MVTWPVIFRFSGSNPVKITKPPELEGMTLEERLVSYDWDNYFEDFERTMLDGTFRSICWNARNERIHVSLITAINLLRLAL